MRPALPWLRSLPPEIRLAFGEALAAAWLTGSAVAALILGGRWLYSTSQIEMAIAFVGAFGLFLSLASGLAPNIGNPAVTLARAALLRRPVGETGLVTAAQIAGAISGMIFVQWLLNLDAVQHAPAELSGITPYLYNALGTFLLACTILAFPKNNSWLADPGLWRGYQAAIIFVALNLGGLHIPLCNPAATIAQMLSSGPLGVDLYGAVLLAGLELACGLAAACLALILARSGQSKPRFKFEAFPESDAGTPPRNQAAGVVPSGNSSTAITKPLESSTTSSHKEI
jgi:hypothetical protein